MKIEMHTHTKESSPCAKLDASSIVSLYKEAGYDTVVITDHYNKWCMEQSGAASADEYTEYFFKGFEAAKKAAGDELLILPGIEVSLLESPNDFLLYGITKDFLYDNPDIFRMTLKELHSLCKKNNILLIQAHPNRGYCNPAPVDFLDGMEVYNGNPHHNNNNEKTYDIAKENNLIMTSGSDFHDKEYLARGGIITDTRINNINELTEILKSSSYRLICDGEGK